MTEYPCPVDRCIYPCHDAAFCVSCRDQLERDLAEVPAYSAELETALSRQTAMGDRNGGRSADKPLPYDAGASEALTVLRSTLVGWVRVAVEEDDAAWPADTLDAMSQLLLRRISWLRGHPAGAEAVEEVAAAMRLARRAVDRPADQLFAGVCGECREALYARQEATTVVCRTCSLEYDVDTLQADLKARLEDVLATAGEISGLCKRMFGEWVTTAMIRSYAHRGAIGRHGSKLDARGKVVPLYRMGEVFDAAQKASKDPRTARRNARTDAEEAA